MRGRRPAGGGVEEGAPNVILVGFMGVGKSAAGTALARRLRREFVDTDELIAQAAGMDIPSIFRAEGEAGFREREEAAAAQVGARRGLVVATGGGILGREANVSALRRGGVLIGLVARPEVILRRTAPWEERPLLRGPDPPLAVERLLAERAPQYALADWTLDTSDLEIGGVVDRICEKLPSLYPLASTRS